MKWSAPCEISNRSAWRCSSNSTTSEGRYETRPHHDLDIIVRIDDVPTLLDACESSGFAVREGAPPHAFVLVDPLGRELDVHSVAFHPDGTATHRMDSGNDWLFSADAFSGTGTVDGAKVVCLSAQTQVLCHAQDPSPTADAARRAANDADNRKGDAQAKAFADGLPTARVVRIPRANHYVFMSNEADVIRELDSFVGALK